MALWKKILVILLLPAAFVATPQLLGVGAVLVAGRILDDLQKSEVTVIILVNFLLYILALGLVAAAVVDMER